MSGAYQQIGASARDFESTSRRERASDLESTIMTERQPRRWSVPSLGSEPARVRAPWYASVASYRERTNKPERASNQEGEKNEPFLTRAP